MNKNNDNWNPEDWQGKSKQQYESSAFGAGISFAALFVLILCKLISNLF